MADRTSRHGPTAGERADADDGNLSLSGTTTAGETTPLLLQSDAGSTRDGAISDPEVVSEDGDSDDDDVPPTIGKGRAFALIMSMWALIFLQGAHINTPSRPSIWLAMRSNWLPTSAASPHGLAD